MPTRIVLGDPAIAKAAKAMASPADPAVLAAMEAGEEIDRVPETWAHPMVGKLHHLARLFVVHAREHTNAEAAAVGHILTAVERAIMAGDLDALNGQNGPHTWARGYLGEHGGLPIRIEDAKGRVVDMDDIIGGFHLLRDWIRFAIEETRAANLDLDWPPFVEEIGDIMLQHFPSVPSLQFPNEPDWLKQITAVTERIGPQLRVLGRKHRAQAPETLAPDIAEELLTEELKLSNRSASDIARAFRFRKH
jgi:hypothetical protein